MRQQLQDTQRQRASPLSLPLLFGRVLGGYHFKGQYVCIRKSSTRRNKKVYDFYLCKCVPERNYQVNPMVRVFAKPMILPLHELHEWTLRSLKAWVRFPAKA